MAVRSVLVPTDFSETSDAALHYATEMALTLGARLYLMYVPGKTGEHFEPRDVKVEQRTESRVVISGLPQGTEIALVDPTARTTTTASPSAPTVPAGGGPR